MSQRPIMPASGLQKSTNLSLSVAIITFNEEKKLARCLESIADIASEIVLVDSHSTDGTRLIAEQFGARVIKRDWPGYAAQKQFAMEQCHGDWVLSLDADEALDVIAVRAIEEALAEDNNCNGYVFNRLNWYLGDWVRHAWYPEWRLRLARNGTGTWIGTHIHEHLSVPGRTRRLSGNLLHYSYDNLQHHLQQTLHYGRIAGEEVAMKNRRITITKLLLSPAGRFLRMLLIKQAWRDGWRGWVIAFSSLLAGFAKYAFAIERQRTDDSDP